MGLRNNDTISEDAGDWQVIVFFMKSSFEVAAQKSNYVVNNIGNKLTALYAIVF